MHFKTRLLLCLISLTQVGFAQIPFSSPEIITTWVSRPSIIKPLDVTDDGAPDVISISDNMLAWYENTGSEPMFGNQNPISVTLNAGYMQISDINNDGYKDLIVTSYTSHLPSSIYWMDNQSNPSGLSAPQEIVDSLWRPQSFHFKDIDNDAGQDIVVLCLGSIANWYNDAGLYWYEKNDSTNTFDSCHLIQDSTLYESDFDLADFDGDGDQDIITTRYNDSLIQLYLNQDGNGNFSNAVIIDKTPYIPVHSVAEDVDSDSHIDLIVKSYSGNRLVWYPNTGTQNIFGNPVIIDSTVAEAALLHLADIDNDNDREIITLRTDSNNNQHLVYYKKMSGSYSGPKKLVDNTGEVTFIQTSDLDNDGDLDMIGAYRNDDKIVWFENYLIPPIPEADFEASDSTVSPGDTIIFTSLMQAPVDSVKWNFGDGQSSNKFNPSHVYTNPGTYNVSLMAWNSTGGDTIVKKSFINVVTGIESTKHEELRIFPNPSSGYINIKSNSGQVLNIDVFNAQGQLIKSVTPKKQQPKLNISDLAPGVLLLRLETKQNTINQLIIKE
ncbi:MAG: FG-GAP-like repeat-containing protein [Bacteroidales bacterium]|nr:FG-GAP-like repeat-containing protein [Bacteroidales bacterium]